MLPDRVSNPGPLTYESGALLIALCSPAGHVHELHILIYYHILFYAKWFTGTLVRVNFADFKSNQGQLLMH